jgi:PEGA domain
LQISPKRLGPAATTRLLALLTLPTALACRAERHLVFETDPTGATVRLDDQVVGQTPLDLRFEHYGSRQLTIYREGFRTYSTVIEVDTPWYSYFPLDFITEVLLPFGWEDTHRFEVVLEEETGRVTDTDLADVLQRAETLRRAGPGGPAVIPGDDGAATTEGPREISAEDTPEGVIEEPPR